RLELAARHGAAEFERLLGAPDAALGVDHERQLVVAPRDAAVGAQLTGGEGEVPRRVGGDRGRLPRHADPAGATRGGESVPVGERGILVDETAGHHEVLGDPVGVVLAERLELGARGAVELIRGDVVGDDGVVVAGAGIGVAGRTRARLAGTGSGARCGSRSALRSPGSAPSTPACGARLPGPRLPAAGSAAAGSSTARSGRPVTAVASGSLVLVSHRSPWSAHAMATRTDLGAWAVKRRRPTRCTGGPPRKKSGGVLLSHEVPLAVPSAL